MKGLSKIIADALNEDIGSGDVTTDALIPEDVKGRAVIIAGEPLVIAGMDVAAEVFKQIDADVSFLPQVTEGSELAKGSEIAVVTGRLSSILKGERVALNLLQRLSGIATLTRTYVRAVEGFRAKVIDTRKTTPGLRALEKYAVTVGGGRNHRFGLFDGVLIKDNHLSAAGGITEAVKRAREKIPHTLKVEVEVEKPAQVMEALSAGADIIMLDNMDVDNMSEAVKVINGKALVEASGGITVENIRRVAETGVDLISVGAITHSARWVDISMEVS